MRLVGRLSQNGKGVGSIIGAIFVALILLSGFAFYAVTLDATQHYNNTMSSMSDADWGRNEENIVIKQIAITGTNQLNVTAENDGSIQSHLIWLGIFNTTATPQNQTYQALNEYVGPGEIGNIVSSSAVTGGNQYVIQLVTELGNTVESKFYPADYASCALTLVTTPPTVYQGNNITVLLTVTPNDTVVDSIQSLTAAINTTPTNLVQLVDNSPLSVSGLTRGTSAFFWWTYNATSTGSVTFNATYLQAPAGTYVLSTAQIVSPPQQGGQGSVTVTGVNCTALQNPSHWNLFGSTQNVSGSVSDLANNDATYANFSSYYSGTTANIDHFVDNNSSNVDSNDGIGSHSNFTALQYGPDSIYDTLTEQALGGGLAAFGKEDVGAASFGFTGYLEASRYICGQSGSVTKITLYLSGGTVGRYARVAIYSDNNGAPSSLLDQSSQQEISSDGWYDFTGFDVPVSGNAYYWLAFQISTSSLNYWYDSGQTDQHAYRTYTYGSFPPSFGSPSYTAFAQSIYASFEVNSAFEYGQAFKSSNVRVTTNSGGLVDDSQAVLNVNLTKNSTLFTIYNAGNDIGSTENIYGKGCAINVDGVDMAFSWQAPTWTNGGDSVTVVYAANMTAGSHVIKGRFFANSAGNTVGIDMRQIVAFWFPSVIASFVRSNTTSTTSSAAPVDDPQATSTFTLNSGAVAFIIYNAGNKLGSTEPAAGKGITINVDGTDISTREWQSAQDANNANSATIAYVGSLGAGSHTIKGRFFSNSAGSTTTINERQLMVFCFPASVITYGFVQSTTTVSTSSTSFVDDTQAVLTPTLTGNSDSLIMYVGGNPPGATEYVDGKGVELQVDGVDMSNSTSWQSPYNTNYGDSATSLWCQQLTNDSHTIKGRFSSNSGYSHTVTVSHRQLLVLAFPVQQINYKLAIEVQWTNVDLSQQNSQLCIYAESMGSNALGVDYWNGSNWINLNNTLTAYGWTNMSAVLTGSNFTIRFEAGIYTNDTIQGTWNIDAVLLHQWTTNDQYTAEVEFTGSSNSQSWTQLVWQVVSSWNTANVSVTIQVFNYTLGNYPSSGNGYVSYVSSSTPNTDELGSQTITSGATQFRNSTNYYWKVKIKGVKSTSTQFQMRINWIELQDSYAYAGDNVPYKAWIWYMIQATGANGNPIPYTYASLYTNGTNVTLQNATNGTYIQNPAWLLLDANGTLQLKISSTTSSGETFVLYISVGTVVQQKTITQAAQQ
jgi:hypothetical protein